MKMYAVDKFELGMLANSFDLYAESAKYVRDNGAKMVIVTERGSYYQICPEFTVMKSEYSNILKHSGKFGLNPGDREKIFKSLANAKPAKKGFNLGDKMKIA
jgi:phage terminase small subunit